MRQPRPVLLAIIALALLLPACASQKKPYRNVSGRDYSSVNKRSIAFLGEGIRDNKRLRKQVWPWSELWTENARNRKQSLSFLGSSLALGEIENMKTTWGNDFPNELKGPDDFWASLRFGFLDSGE